MGTLQIKELNSNLQMTIAQQQQLYGGGAKELLQGYANGSYRLEKSGQLFNFINARGERVGSLISKDGYNFFIQNGKIEAVKGGSIDSILNVGSILRI